MHGLVPTGKKEKVTVSLLIERLAVTCCRAEKVRSGNANQLGWLQHTEVRLSLGREQEKNPPASLVLVRSRFDRSAKQKNAFAD